MERIEGCWMSGGEDPRHAADQRDPGASTAGGGGVQGGDYHGAAGAGKAAARQVGVEMPVTFAVEAILDGKLDPRSAVVALMTRELKEEAAL